MNTCGDTKTVEISGEPHVPAAQRRVAACPQCGRMGKAVPTQTVRALVAISLREVPDKEYRFCASPECAVVYYAPGTGNTLTRDQLRERVYQKEPGHDDVLICYCFRHTMSSVNHSEMDARATVLGDITAGIKAGQCACDLRNPQGSCCLGNVRALIALGASG
ncbi:MAG: hypothetical protein HC822_24595 [Oscillochloris sp.]|nr:hypothetical protein [Oscillochloris sp.]